MSVERHLQVRVGDSVAWARQRGELGVVSRVMRLRPGISSLQALPPGSARGGPGDVAEVEIEGVGTLGNPVVEG